MFCLLFKNSKACNLQQLKENFDFDTAAKPIWRSR